MQRIINGLLYDTRNSDLVHSEEDTKRQLFKTNNGNFFMFYSDGEIIPKTEDSVKEYLGRKNVKKYEEIFGKVEEA